MGKGLWEFGDGEWARLPMAVHVDYTWSRAAIQALAADVLALNTNESVRNQCADRFAAGSDARQVLGWLHVLDACMKGSTKLLPGIKAGLERWLHPGVMSYTCCASAAEAASIQQSLGLLMWHWYALGFVSRAAVARRFWEAGSFAVRPDTIDRLASRPFGGWFWYAGVVAAARKVRSGDKHAQQHAATTAVVSAGAEEPACVLCGDPFTLAFSDDLNDWVLKEGVRYSGGLAHDVCVWNNSTAVRDESQHATVVPVRVQAERPAKRRCTGGAHGGH